MLQNRKRLLQLALAVVAAVGIVPMVNNNHEWPHVSEQEQQMVTAMREMNPPTVAKKPAAPSEPEQTTVAEVPAAKKITRKKTKKMVATVPGAKEEHFTVTPSHYRLRDTKVIREIAKLEQDE